MERSTEESNAFYDTLQQTGQRFHHQLFFILGDFNAKIEQRCEGDTFLCCTRADNEMTMASVS